jgi:hypothetical protein
MAVTITRSIWVDDDGSGTTGTVINQALHTTLYNEIDTALAKVAQLAGGNAFTGNQSIAGLLSVVGFGAHTFYAAGTGSQGLLIRNSSAGSTNKSEIQIGNDANAALLDIVSYASNFTPQAGTFDQPNGSVIYQGGAGGLSMVAGAGILRLFTGVSERMRIASTGEVLVNRTAVGAAAFQVSSPQASQWGVLVNSIVDQPNGIFIAFTNAAAGIQGSITAPTSSTVSFLTSSDARLKDDAGRATDVTALRAVVVHDFTWKADGVRDRGVFAQDAHALYPRAVAPGTDDTTETGSLARPWMTDYSKFVPDLIVGWQQHDAELAELRAILAAVKG